MALKVKVAIVVHGRFFVFDMARELVCLGEDITIFTNYPKSIAKRFGIPPRYVRNNLLHGIVSRFLWTVRLTQKSSKVEAFLNRWFSAWAARQLDRQLCDIVYVFSGVFEEIARRIPHSPPIKILIRASSHIRTQQELMRDEEKRVGSGLEKPSDWIVRREEREYELCDRILVLSTFSRKTFLDHGVPEGKIDLLPLGAQLAVFRPSRETVRARAERILSGQPLRVLTVGTFSYRKGALDLIKTAETLSGRFHFRFVGHVEKELERHIMDTIGPIEFVPKQPQNSLPDFYAWGDVFVFPTLEDGYPVVLSQALASGLPVIATTNCSSADILKEGNNGWIVPIRSPEAIIERLLWINTNRREYAKITSYIAGHFERRDWSQVAMDFAAISVKAMEAANAG